jgi:predicted aspartyl protease
MTGGETMRHTLALTILPLACLFAGPALAQPAATPAPAAPCTKPLTVVNEVQMTARGPGPSSVPVEINGVKENLTFATAGTATQLTEDTAKKLGLTITGDGEIALFDRMGRATSNQVSIAKFVIGTAEGSNLKFPISPGGGFGGGGFGGGAGLFSLNHMLPYDVDVDFGTDKLRFFSQDHCPGGVLYWQASVVGVLPLSIDRGRVTVPVEIDGKALTGVIDTAALDLSIKEAVAERVLGLEAGMEGKTHIGTLRLGTLGLRNINFKIRSNGAIEGGSAVASAQNRSAAVQNALAQPEVIIGMELLRKLHLYMAFGEKKLYITPASARPATATAAAPPPGR